jgi:hypothetical protein
MPTTVRVIISGINIADEVKTYILKNTVKAKKDAFIVGKKILTYLNTYINSHRKRPVTGGLFGSNLLRYINKTYEEFDLGNTWGVSMGDIPTLNQFARYWAAVNWGSGHILYKKVPSGQFAPGEARPTPSAFRQGRWFPISGGGFQFGFETYSFVAKKGIPAMNYIENTFHYASIQVDKALAKIGKPSAFGGI